VLPVVHKLILDSPYRLQRVVSFLDPWQDPQGSGYQLIQSMIAIGSGGPFGKGLGEGVQKLGFLPLANSDFIFSMVGEELGFLGAVAVIGAFMWLVWEGIRIALKTRDGFGFALAFGISLLIGLQAAVNIAVVTGSVPTKGLSLPFVSAGGSSLFFTLWGAGILVNIARSLETPAQCKLIRWEEDVPSYERTLRSFVQDAGSKLPGAIRHIVKK
jgi:cell division protein FtsW